MPLLLLWLAFWLCLGPLGAIAFGAALMRLWESPQIIVIGVALVIVLTPLAAGLGRFLRPNPFRRR